MNRGNRGVRRSRVTEDRVHVERSHTTENKGGEEVVDRRPRRSRVRDTTSSVVTHENVEKKVQERRPVPVREHRQEKSTTTTVTPVVVKETTTVNTRKTFKSTHIGNMTLNELILCYLDKVYKHGLKTQKREEPRNIAFMQLLTKYVGLTSYFALLYHTVASILFTPSEKFLVKKRSAMFDMNSEMLNKEFFLYRDDPLSQDAEFKKQLETRAYGGKTFNLHIIMKAMESMLKNLMFELNDSLKSKTLSEYVTLQIMAIIDLILKETSSFITDYQTCLKENVLNDESESETSVDYKVDLISTETPRTIPLVGPSQ